MKFTAQATTVFLMTLFLATQTFATNNAPATSSTVAGQTPAATPLLSGFIQLSRSTSLYDFHDGTRGDGMDYSARLNMAFSKNYTFRLEGAYSQDLNNADSSDPLANDFSDTSLSLIHQPVALGKLFLLGYSAGLVAPTSKNSRTLQNLQGGASGSLMIMVNPDRLISGLTLVGGLSLRKNFHQYDTAINGSVNTAYSSSQTFSIGYDWASGVGISASFIHKNGLTYQNNIKEAFEHNEELGYTINKTFAVAVGHTNAGNALKENGSDSNLALINDNTSLVYASLTTNF